MNPKGKKFLSLFLVFSLMMLSANLYAKERRGAKLWVFYFTGDRNTSPILPCPRPGELIAVKEDSLLLFLPSRRKSISIKIKKIYLIEIVEIPKELKGIGLGEKKEIRFEGMTDSEIQETLDYLRKIARIRNYR